MKRIFFMAAALLLAAGCGQKRTNESMRGRVEDGIYRNGFFGFAMDVPDGMYVMPRAAMDSLAAAMGSVAGAGGERAGETSDLLLFLSAEDPSAAGAAFNYNITVMSERVSGLGSAESDERYMSRVIRTLRRGADSDGGDMPVGRTALGGREFMKLTLARHGVEQDVYARLHGGYALLLIGSYDGPEQREAVARILATLSFEDE